MPGDDALGDLRAAGWLSTCHEILASAPAAVRNGWLQQRSRATDALSLY
jgi:hypothetical protein